MHWYPIRLTAHIRTYSFGDRLIPERLGKRNLPGGVVAETWEISDYRDTTGTVINGALAGQTLHRVTMEHPDELVGAGWRGPHFPLLGKFLDASHMLPVHLHADDETAHRLYGAPNGKTEAWHILWAAPGATILAGIRPGVKRADLFAAFKAQDYLSVMPSHTIYTGDTVYVPGGVLHAFGPNTMIFEVQQTSDLAQTVMPADLFGNRLSDAQWDANINATLDELRTDYLPRPHAGLTLPGVGKNRATVGCAGPYFALERWTLRAPHPVHLDGRHCLTLSNIGAPVRLDYAAGTETLDRGDSCLLPAALGDCMITPIVSGEVVDPGSGGETALIVCYVPDLARDIVAPLRTAGHGAAAIAALGQISL